MNRPLPAVVDVAADPHRPEVLVLGLVEFVKAQARRRRVQLQVKGRGLGGLLLVAGQSCEAVGESVGNPEVRLSTDQSGRLRQK